MAEPRNDPIEAWNALSPDARLQGVARAIARMRAVLRGETPAGMLPAALAVLYIARDALREQKSVLMKDAEGETRPFELRYPVILNPEKAGLLGAGVAVPASVADFSDPEQSIEKALEIVAADKTLSVLGVLTAGVIVVQAGSAHEVLLMSEGQQKVLAGLHDDEQREAYLRDASDPYCIGWGGGKEQPSHDECANKLRAELDKAPGLGLSREQGDEKCSIFARILFHPLTVDLDESSAYFPVVVSLFNVGPGSRLRNWGNEDRESLIDGFLGELEASIAQIKDKASKALGGKPPDITRPEPQIAQPSPGRIRSVMSPVPIPRKAMALDRAATIRGLGRMFSGYSTTPDLDILGKTATEKATDLFWSTLETYLRVELDARRGCSWEIKEDERGRRVLDLRGMEEPDVRALWNVVSRKLNKGEGGPGLEVRPPFFASKTHYDAKTGQIVSGTQVTFWPENSLQDREGQTIPPVKFRAEGSPGYQALLKEHGQRPFFADGWLWVPQANTREGFRIGGLPTLLFPEGRAAVERIRRRRLADYETELNRILREPSLFADEDARTVRDLRAASVRVKRWLETISLYDCQDLVLCIYEEFYRQRNEWEHERIRLPDGKEVPTHPWRVLCLLPDDLRARLDPGRNLGQNWRARILDRLEALATFERQTRTLEGKKIDVGDRLVRRAIDGLHGRESGEAPDGDIAVGLIRLLQDAGAFPVNAFFVEVSLDFMASLYVWAKGPQDEIYWGIEAAKRTEQRARLAAPAEKRQLKEEANVLRRRVRETPYYEHSPRLQSFANLNRWPIQWKNFAYVLLQEKTPNFARRRDASGRIRTSRKQNQFGGKDKLTPLDGRDYIACHGSRGYGYKVAVWMKKAGFEKRRGRGGGRQAYRAFLECLRTFRGENGIELRLELAAGSKWDEKAMAVLEGYKSSPGAAAKLILKPYLPADLETRLRDRLSEAGIDAEDEEQERSILTPSSPGGLAPADVRVARLRAKWTQKDLARKLGVAQAAISIWETRKKPIPRKYHPLLRELLRIQAPE